MDTLKSKKEFDFVYKNGFNRHNSAFALYIYKEGASQKNSANKSALDSGSDTRRALNSSPNPAPSLYGLSVSKKVGNAITRNLIKRRARVLIRESSRIALGFRIVFVAKEGIVKLSFAEFKDAYEEMLGFILGKLGKNQPGKTASKPRRFGNSSTANPASRANKFANSATSNPAANTCGKMSHNRAQNSKSQHKSQLKNIAQNLAKNLSKNSLQDSVRHCALALKNFVLLGSTLLSPALLSFALLDSAFLVDSKRAKMCLANMRLALARVRVKA
ncbi:ribonuclease P protein component [Helicobacter sp. CLO-3]|uniref:ribonuclease P protein component n=1 Tax=unclassified Helicobacter TaxID=2593540 RepID=UPI000804C5DB|nr:MULTISPECIES: ribonuclease P protein component [unclassified Helicobacter]OBV29918.1 ribonuclease P protein component [Helicobacter sp. CLO-3]OHU81763.1 ribonuclease P protein component [Helicobacter sp. CLO-3]